MSQITDQLVRLKRAVVALDQAIAAREAAHSAALEAARADASAVALRVDQAIERLEAVLES
ncbi:MAG: hypothetical protein H6843_11105 [Rhodospirillaceae bacterium]|nr:hypothetical protein [Rhodospirillaceae bacterium]